jgi:O-antigen/teichoic acid export membrane protein
MGAARQFMHANIGMLPDDAPPLKKPRERLISLPYLLLRGSTAAGAFAMGFVQTFVFARVLSPDRFSVFIVVGAIGYTLWFSDLGLAKILFVKLRAPHLAGNRDDSTARQATAVISFYIFLAIVASLACFAITMAQTASTPRGAFDLALFMLFITLNLAWFSLRTISIAVDLFVYFERLELVRRVVNIATLLAMLIGLPFTGFLIGSNLLWCALFAVASIKLIGRGALVPRWHDAPRELLSFFRLNRRSIARSSTGALSGLFVATFPYYFVPLAYGLGAAPIILEVTFRIFRGGCVIDAAICDLAIPGQTRALAARDAGRLVRTTLLVTGLCCVPAAIGCALLIFAGGPLFTFLLRSAATVPPGIVPILVALLIANILQIVSEALLQYSGFFRSLAYNGAAVVIMMAAITAVSAAAKFDIVGFLAAYAAVYTVGAIGLAVAAVWGPIRATALFHGSTGSWSSALLSRDVPRPRTLL